MRICSAFTEVRKKDVEFKNVDTNIEEISKLNDNFTHMLDVLNERSKKLYEAKVHAENANKLKDNFLANMSHELKTPLNSINIISNIMLKNKSNNLNQKEIENLSIIHKCGESLVYLVNDMLDLSKVDANNIALENKIINIKDMINKIYINFEKKAIEKGLDSNLFIDRKLDLMFCDETKINQIIKILLSNALKFSYKGTISFIVKDNMDEIKILIEDQGIGIEEDNFEFIFDRFTQIDSSTTRKYSGIGLGLAICKELVLLLNGKISVKSKINEGSSFEIILPKNKELINMNELKEPKVKLEILDSRFNISSDIKKQEKNKILVLHDDHLLFFNIIIELKKKYEVKQVLNLQDLLKHKNELNYEKIIVDISKLDESEKELLFSNISDSFLIIYEDEKDRELLNSVKSFQKPLTKDLIQNIIYF